MISMMLQKVKLNGNCFVVYWTEIGPIGGGKERDSEEILNREKVYYKCITK